MAVTLAVLLAGMLGWGMVLAASFSVERDAAPQKPIRSTQLPTANRVKQAMPVRQAMQEHAERSVLQDPRDGQAYAVEKLGSLWWMQASLNHATEFSIEAEDATLQNAPKARLYAFDAAQKACPDQWRLPTEREWDRMMELATGPRSDSVLDRYHIATWPKATWAQAREGQLMRLRFAPTGMLDVKARKRKQWKSGSFNCWLAPRNSASEVPSAPHVHAYPDPDRDHGPGLLLFHHNHETYQKNAVRDRRWMSVRCVSDTGLVHRETGKDSP